MEKTTYRTRRELNVLAIGSLFIFSCLGIGSISLVIGPGFYVPQNRAVAIFAGLTSLFFAGISTKLYLDQRPQFRFSDECLEVIDGKSVREYLWADLLGYESTGPNLAGIKFRFKSGVLRVPFASLAEGGEMGEAVMKHLQELGKDKPTPPSDIQSVLEARWILLGCLCLINLFPLLLIRQILERMNSSDLVLLGSFGFVDVFVLLYASRRTELTGGVLTRQWLFGRTTIHLDLVDKLVLRTLQGRSGQYEEMRLEGEHRKISFSSADTHYVSLRDRTIELAPQAILVDNRVRST